MARKFLYIVAGLLVVVIGGAFAFRLYPLPIMRMALVPTEQFVAPAAAPPGRYADPALWMARPGMSSDDPTQWRPRIPDTASHAPGEEPTEAPRLATIQPRGDAAIFFVHPTSYLKRDHWNAPLDDREANWRAGLFVQGMASAFAPAGDIWVPRYRQAAIGAFLASDVETANRALLAAYGDVEQAFDQFLREIGPDRPIILAGHSQGSLHLSRLLRDRIAGRPVARRIVAAYLVGWPISMTTDLPAMGLPACRTAENSNCILGWQSFAEPADASMVTRVYDQTEGFTGGSRAGTRMLCVNPISGELDGTAERSANLGTLRPDDDLSDGFLNAGFTGATCEPERGFLFIGNPPDMGGYILPGNNYHVFDYPLFWANVRADVLRRLAAFEAR